MKSHILRSAALALAALLFAGISSAQSAAPRIDFPQASPAATIKQRLGVTDIEVQYSRPSMKGREIFGKLVPYGQVWRTGANAATKITFSTPVNVGGAAVPAGTYGLYTIPDEKEWTIIIHKDSAQWGSYSYKQENDVVRVKAKPEKLDDPVETFTIGIGQLHPDSAKLCIEWDKTRVSVPITVDVVGALVPQIEELMASNADKKPYAYAALFYLDNKIDLPKAAKWMEKALEEDPNAFWLRYRQGLILQAMGDKAGARAAANASIEGARKAGGAVGDEYVSLNNQLLESLK